MENILKVIFVKERLSNYQNERKYNISGEFIPNIPTIHGIKFGYCVKIGRPIMYHVG